MGKTACALAQIEVGQESLLLVIIYFPTTTSQWKKPKKKKKKPKKTRFINKTSGDIHEYH